MPITESAIDTREFITLPNPKDKISFNDLYLKALDIQSLCEDFTVSRVSDRNMRLDGYSGALTYAPDFTDHRESPIRNSKMSRYSMGQLCNKLGVPVRYIEKCYDAGLLDLASENINAWLQDYNKDLLIREYDGKIRGILSNRYMTFDTHSIMDVLSSVVDSDQYSTKGYFLSPERFHARIVQNEMMNIAGEDLFAGIQIDSSDVGRSTLQVRFMIFKQVCTNGLCISKGGGVLFEQRHIGLSIKEFHDSFEESMTRIPFLMENAVELIESARRDDGKFNVAHFDESEMTEFVERMKLKTRLSDESMSKVVSMMTEKYSPTRWGLINSITEVAQDFTLERRVELEKIAGDLLLVA